MLKLNFRNTEKFESLLSLLIVEESDIQEEGKAEDTKCKKDGQEKEKGNASGTKEMKETKPTVKTKSGGESSPEDEAPQAGSLTSGESELGRKKEKDVMVIVEELRTLRDHQADLINQLMAELSYAEKENAMLRNQVCGLGVCHPALCFPT